MSRALAFLAAAAVFAIAPAAVADDVGASADITGAWSFVSDPTYAGCSLRGEVFIRPSDDPDTFTCEMVANDVCPDVWTYRAEQSCVATRDGDALVIQSRIETVEPATDRYLPDNFVLRIIDGSYMTGKLHSAMTTRADFYRQDGPIS